MLVVDCCIRGDESWTRKYYQSFLEKNHIKNVDVVDLQHMAMVPIDAAYLQQRDALRYAGRFDDPFFQLARQFRDANDILIAAPYWDLAFPALLKVYLEHVAVCDLTFGYDASGNNIGYCKADRLLYFSSCGGYIEGEHLGFSYIKAFANMLGIENCQSYTLEGMDIDPSLRQSIFDQAIQKF